MAEKQEEVERQNITQILEDDDEFPEASDTEAGSQPDLQEVEEEMWVYDWEEDQVEDSFTRALDEEVKKIHEDSKKSKTMKESETNKESEMNKESVMKKESEDRNEG
ncbi:probable 26S proteasome complex subunit sem1 isoform X2 [Maniola jurtina]|uniref:probable 26S proteasome complex subunit sem1 isoform X2 n=1 Tax=Maniola jurtina TaxID=191418 RepID=UPI001E687CB1|nr:probable 26S proteasome complex subunit sem1 isoform X2 [Maniola jurtina]